MSNTFVRLVVLTLLCAPFAAAQTAGDTKLRHVIIFGRHSVRAPVAPNSMLDTFAAKPFPVPSVGTGILTANGAKLESLLGAYYRLWLTREGLLTGNDEADAAFTYFRANTPERTRVTAQSFATGLLPAAAVTVNTYPDGQSDPLFDPIGAGVARLEQKKAVQAVKGRLGGDGRLVTSASAPELALARSVLLDPSTKVVMLVASDVNITALAGLLNLDWILPTYQPDFCPPGGALVFPLRQSQRTGKYFVRASYISQTLDQLRNRTPL